MAKYIEHTDNDMQLNEGFVTVWIANEIVESIFINDYEEENPGNGIGDLIDEMKVKYDITKVKYKQTNWIK